MLDIEPEAPVAELPDSLPEIELESFDGIEVIEAGTEAGSLANSTTCALPCIRAPRRRRRPSATPRSSNPWCWPSPALLPKPSQNRCWPDLDLGGSTTGAPLTKVEAEAIASLSMPDAAEAGADAPSAEPHEVLEALSAVPVVEPVAELVAEPVVDLAADLAAERAADMVTEAPAERAAEPVPEPIAEPEPEVEEVKHIGPLEISATLFNIFLSEADELSRRLQDGLAGWAAEPGTPCPLALRPRLTPWPEPRPPSATRNSQLGARWSMHWSAQRAAYFEPGKPWRSSCAPPRTCASCCTSSLPAS